MNLRIMMLVVIALLAGTYAFAEKEQADVAVMAVSDQAAPAAINAGNKICPVGGEKIDGSMGEIGEYEYKGKIYNLCCKMCLDDFQKNPEKYSKIADDEVAKAAAEAAK